MEKRKQFLFFGILIAGFIGLVAVSPTIYAIVEPHITINMESGQTTKPFVINDNTGTEVFSVDVDGTISPAVTGTNGVSSISFFQKDEFTVFASESNPHIFAHYRLTWDLCCGTGKTDLKINSAMVSGELRIAPLTGVDAAGTGDLGLVGGTITNGGSGYAPNSAFPITITGGGGSGASADARSNSAGVIFVITNIVSGSGYTSVPTITIPPPASGTQATATARLGVVDLLISNGGTNYNYGPSITFTGGGGSGATGFATITGFEGSVDEYHLLSKGLDYTSPPTAVFGGVDASTVGVNVEVTGHQVGQSDDFSEITNDELTYANSFENLFESNFFMNDFTTNTIDIFFRGYYEEGSNRAPATLQIRNMLWNFELFIPDFVTVERIS